MCNDGQIVLTCWNSATATPRSRMAPSAAARPHTPAPEGRESSSARRRRKREACRCPAWPLCWTRPHRHRCRPCTLSSGTSAKWLRSSTLSRCAFRVPRRCHHPLLPLAPAWGIWYKAAGTGAIALLTDESQLFWGEGGLFPYVSPRFPSTLSSESEDEMNDLTKLPRNEYVYGFPGAICSAGSLL